jgi:imidazolonepropionase
LASLIVRARTIVTCDTDAAQAGVDFERLRTFSDGAIVVEDGRVTAVGAASDVLRDRNGAEVIDLGKAVVVPGLVDAHAHPFFSGDREPDFAARIAGAPAPLGMLYTVERTRAALLDPNAFYRDVLAPRLQTILRHGTTTLEVKSGYALHKPGEAALLDLMHEHRDEPATPRLVPTVLGAHALPPEFEREGHDAFVDYCIDQIIPMAAGHGAKYADAFCEPGFFSPGQTRRYLKAARENGLRLRVHCDEMSYGGAAAMAVECGVDAVVTVACPATIQYLDLARSAPVRALLNAGGSVALASDFNPGTSPCFNLQTVAYFGRKLFGLSAAEALYGVTRAAAASLREDAGVIRVGARADFVALQIASPEEFGWQFGGNLATFVVKNGVRVDAI